MTKIDPTNNTAPHVQLQDLEISPDEKSADFCADFWKYSRRQLPKDWMRYMDIQTARAIAALPHVYDLKKAVEEVYGNLDSANHIHVFGTSGHMRDGKQQGPDPSHSNSLQGRVIVLDYYCSGSSPINNSTCHILQHPVEEIHQVEGSATLVIQLGQAHFKLSLEDTLSSVQRVKRQLSIIEQAGYGQSAVIWDKGTKRDGYAFGISYFDISTIIRSQNELTNFVHLAKTVDDMYEVCK